MMLSTECMLISISHIILFHVTIFPLLIREFPVCIFKRTADTLPAGHDWEKPVKLPALAIYIQNMSVKVLKGIVIQSHYPHSQKLGIV